MFLSFTEGSSAFFELQVPLEDRVGLLAWPCRNPEEASRLGVSKLPHHHNEDVEEQQRRRRRRGNDEASGICRSKETGPCAF